MTKSTTASTADKASKEGQTGSNVQLKVDETTATPLTGVPGTEPGSTTHAAHPEDFSCLTQLDDPFGKQIGSDSIFKHHQLDELRQMVRTTINQHSMMLVSGPPGVGKTTGVRSVTDELPVNRYSIHYLGQDQNGSNMLRRFTEGLGIRPKGFRPNHVLQISQWLSDNLKNGGKQIVLVVDESHLLDDQTLEDLRLLSNADYDRQSPLSMILLAQPWLRPRLKSPFFEPLTQRLRYRYSLEGLGKDETRLYIRARLEAAGLPWGVFTDDAIQKIFSCSEGIPRRINNLCSYLLLRVRTTGMSIVDAELVKTVADLLDS